MGVFSNTRQGADDVVGRVNSGSKFPSTSGSFLSRVHVHKFSTRGVFLAI